MDTKLVVEGLALLAAGERIMIRGPVAVDLSDVHEWATEVTVYRGDTGPLLSWQGGHHHVNRINGALRMVGDSLHVPTVDHGLVVVRPIGPQDTWPVFPANLTAWEAAQQGFT